MQSRSFWAIAAQAAACLFAAACNDGKAFQPIGGPFYQPPTLPATSSSCPVARSSESLVPRVDLTGMSASTVGGQDVAYTSDLFGAFYSFCGGCHVDGAQGDHHIGKSVDAFVAGFDATWLGPIMSDEPDKWMPRPGKAWSARAPGDPIYDFAMHAQAWLSAGRPKGVFAVADGANGGRPPTANYTFPTSVASAMTNIGNCVPTSALFASSTSDVMISLDEFFKGATELPKTLAETDLTSLDSEELAKTAVIAYAPTYALWSAGSGKLRHIRVPRGQSVRFDKATQTFDLPDNTRFYKTFFRKVIDRTGAVTWRKMETRVIVARADDTDPATGAARQNALFGTYIWSEDETTATLATQPYRDQTPWADIVRTYVTDELFYQTILDTTTGSVDGAVALAIRNHPNEPAYRDLMQHYAIPGRIRCVQCHMGSPTRDFVLGFIPLQVKRRATGTGGTYDQTGVDELNQLQRLIDVGVITGITSPDDVKPLEESQGARKPRKTASAEGDEMTADGELQAQAYMLGNCAHCHNPRGFPSITKPELTAVLNFLPDGKVGGIFEFPFERMSPVRSRGAAGDIPMPYITPSLRDYPVTTADGSSRIDTGQSLVSGEVGVLTYTPKFYPYSADPTLKSCANPAADPDFRAYCGERTTGPTFVAAPWRSLIYRNVDTPASYFDDYVPFPHMPMNTAGFDCRAPRIMGDWMAGLPSVRKLEYIASALAHLGVEAPSEDALPESPGRAPALGSLATGYDDNPQPYIDVRPDSDLYQQALADARARLVEYHEGVRYQYCQDVISPDIFDPFVPVNDAYPYPYHPNPYQYQLTYYEDPPLDPAHPDRFVQPRIGVPFHAHWIGYDPTDPPPPWVPRRTDWTDVLVDRKPDTSVPVGTKPLAELEASAPEAAAAFRRGRAVLVRALNEAELSPKLVEYATTDEPFGLWQAKPGCEAKLAASQKKAAEFTGSLRPAWMEAVAPASGAPVYMMSPGAAVYRHVCINCHGPNADGKGLQVDLLAATSEGEARPANFKVGLFGPPEQPLANIFGTFDVTHGGDMMTANRWGARYMAWMALGGTLKRIPQDILQLVGSTPILGVHRAHLTELPGAADATGNMLNLAKGLCAIVLPDPVDPFLPAFHQFGNVDSAAYPPYQYSGSPFVATNYDKEMWMHLCNDFSPRVIRVYGAYNAPGGDGKQTIQLLQMYYAIDPTDPASAGTSFPADAPVWDHAKRVQIGVASDNLYPACLDPDKIPSSTQARLGMPVCPSGFLANGKVLWRDAGLALRFPSDDRQAFDDNVQAWKLRGAIATGMAVFSYLEQRVTRPALAKLPPYYDQCELLP
jgi:mono/diheme cytochrome c family protein